MYFFTQNGDQCIDLRGNLILSHNEVLVKARNKSAGPKGLKNQKYILIKKLGFFRKIQAMFIVFGFIWGKSQELKREDTSYNEKKNKKYKH